MMYAVGDSLELIVYHSSANRESDTIFQFTMPLHTMDLSHDLAAPCLLVSFDTCIGYYRLAQD
jgi:hypothetical protein